MYTPPRVYTPPESHTPPQSPPQHHSYKGGRSKSDFLNFIGQKLQEDKGHARVESLDALVTKFLAATKDADKKKVLKDTEASVKKLGDDVKGNGELYVKFMKKSIEKVGAWVVV